LRRDLHPEGGRLESIGEAAQDVRAGGSNAASCRTARSVLRELRPLPRGGLPGQTPSVELLLDGVASEEGCDR
jgi:hypothetical protein